ncbi:MAG: hypothetical protein QOC81_4895 [Thermoanaerobaculia bacterium]|jgi:hypothetical protein|nr:hypothetical protein [Thermoanaerobaculia bacterium]
MPEYPLSLGEILRDEFSYFFDEPSLKPIQIERSHVRELASLARRLEQLTRRASHEHGKSRWDLLARRLGNEFTEDRLIYEMNAMLVPRHGDGVRTEDDAWLLQHLLDDPVVEADIESHETLRTLLQIPQARRLLLENDGIAQQILADDDLFHEFDGRSAAIRVLLKEGFGSAFERYPALLSTLADDPTLAAAIVANQETRQKLIPIFRDDSKPGFFSRLAFWRPKRQKKPADTLVEPLSLSATELKRTLGLISGPAPDAVVPDRIDDVPLSHFNSILLETAYSDYLADGHGVRAMYEAIHEKEFAALCLSGGGIRSATFNLGILQGLADHRLLTRFHYLSTVSGGGYIGSWLSSWTRRHQEGSTGVAKDLSRQPIDPTEPEVKPIRHLREYSSYLAPNASAFSVDMWTLIATYLRNLLLNWTMLLPALAAMLALPRVMEALINGQAGLHTSTWGWMAAIFGSAAVIGVATVRPKSDRTARRDRVDARRLRRERKRVRYWLVPLIASGIAFVVFWPNYPSGVDPFLLARLFSIAGLAGALIYAMRRAIALTPMQQGFMPKLRGIFQALLSWRAFWSRALREVAAAMMAGWLGGLLLWVCFEKAFDAATFSDGIHLERYASLALPLFLLVFFAEATLLVGFSTLFSSDHDREWWARSAAVMFICAVINALLSISVLILPILIIALPATLTSVGGVSGIISWVLGRRASSESKAKAPSPWAKWILKGAALITLLLIVAVISLATSSLLHWLGTTETFARISHVGPPALEDAPARIQDWIVAPIAAMHLQALRATMFFPILAFFAIVLTAALLMSRLLNVNLYSMHAMYRNRLMRAYLGASRWQRHPDAFTGFDPEDDIAMWELRAEVLWPTSFLDFDAFAGALPAEPWSDFEDLRTSALAYVAIPPPPDRAELQTAILDCINKMMLIRDLENDVTAPCSPALLRENRRFLEKRFPHALKKFDEVIAPVAASSPLTEADFACFEEQFHSPEQPLSTSPSDEQPPIGRPPLHVLNIALNLVGGDNLAWQERKADSFTVSPLHAGNHRLGYRDASEYAESITLGTAMAISGAAVSPNQGHNSSPVVTFLMTLFNARLGWWLGNPGPDGKNTYVDDSPKVSLPYLFDEALGATNDTRSYVFLSDGGHFDNLGLYEMVLRRCKYIVVCDATGDSQYAFGDLANAIRKIRIDLGVPIENLVTKYIGPQNNPRTGRYCATGEIHYKNVDGGTAIGHLLYIKPAVYDDCPADVRNYRKTNDTFPHESTVDQFFSESQFESYRSLGRHTIGEIMKDQVGIPAFLSPNLLTLFLRAKQYIGDVRPPAYNPPINTVVDVVDWMQEALGSM